ncbi:hypothetical protein EV363DRAFT_1382721 [Boletus edulis]|uniref:DUF6533 domain-containing protein n=1 Tax=Boletus edulis BED1 TaxID=1328754 RepID=A0AAD4BIR1_BOLED|nr:hypothetical protein EV363DRAFT_1382721 [Boletus edulis]KAF8431288.1 hypothetical protein L210DRAFT_3560644 [Boletus edulis BED1]
MSFNIQSTLQLLALDNYLSLAGITVVVHDYALTFSREIDYVWCRPWTWVSTMFVVVRYIGLYWIVTFVAGTSFVPGPVKVGQVMNVSYSWAFVVFLSTADLLMILRVYAMWSRSRTVLCVLLSIYTIQTIITVVLYGVYNSPNTYSSVKVVRILNFSFCSGNAPRFFGVYYVVPRLVLSVMMTFLAVFQTLKQSFEMYNATKQWQPNRYMQKLVKDGIIYFVMNVLVQTIGLLIITGLPLSTTLIFLEAFIFIAFYIVIPRFVISIRDLYDRDIYGRFHIDTGFGMQSWSNIPSGAAVSTMVFVDRDQGSEVAGDTDTSADPEMGHRVRGSGLNEDSPIGGCE